MLPDNSPIPASTQRSIVLLSFATFASMVAQRVCDAMLPELSRSFDVGLAQAAQVVAMFAIVYGAAQLVYGPLGDRLGKFPVVTWATLACGLGCALAVFAGSLDMLVLARMATGIAAAAIIPLSVAWIGDNVRLDQLQETLAKVGLGTTMGMGSGQLIGGLITETLGWRWAFVVVALLFAVVGYLLLNDWSRQKVATAAKAAQQGETLAEAAGPVPSFSAQALSIVASPWSRTVMVIAFAEGAAGFGALAMWATHLHRTIALSLTTAGAIVALSGLGGMAYMAVARRLIPRLGPHGLAGVGGCLMGLGALLMAFSPWWALAIPASLLAGFGLFMFHNTLQTHGANMAPHARGTGMSLFSAALFMGQSVGAVLAASLIDTVGSSLMVALAAGTMIALGLWLAHLLHRRAPQRSHTA